MPNATEWRVPHRVWHPDFGPSTSVRPLGAVKVWALCDDVEPTGGGTPQLLGSHRLFARYLEQTSEHRYKEAKLGFLRSHPWLRQLSTPDEDPRRNQRFLDVEADVDGLPARVVELTGRAGDVFITHPWVFHTIAENATSRPRFMRSGAVMAPQGAPLGSPAWASNELESPSPA
jgi:ectoine hydroxylase-related dioxygenase (phytanoyl-CoA dioxygenase family)